MKFFLVLKLQNCVSDVLTVPQGLKGLAIAREILNANVHPANIEFINSDEWYAGIELTEEQVHEFRKRWHDVDYADAFLYENEFVMTVKSGTFSEHVTYKVFESDDYDNTTVYRLYPAVDIDLLRALVLSRDILPYLTT